MERWLRNGIICSLVVVLLIVVFLSVFLPVWFLVIERDSPPVGSGSQPDESGTGDAENANAAVATDVPVCSVMAGKVLENGGTAVDAAITAMLCVGTVNPQSSGIGGGGFMVVFEPTEESVHSFNFREMAPAASTPDMFNSNSTLARRGGLAVAVPGELAGMKIVHDRFGRLSWEQLFEPVVTISKNGFQLTEHAAKAVAYSNQFLKDDPVFRGWFYNSSGGLKQAGDEVKRPEYASLLSMIAQEGPGIVYNGSIAKEIVDKVKLHDGIMTLEDLSSYYARQDIPLKINNANMDVYAPPVPSGGPNLLFALNVMKLLNLSPESAHVNLTYQYLVETFKYMFAKQSYLGDPYCPECSIVADEILMNQADMISDNHAVLISQTISNSQTFPSSHYYPNYVPPDDGTSHISIIDSTGMAVSVTTTINSYFGSKLITPSGIVLNNQMACFSAPNFTSTSELEPYAANFAQPKKRPLSSACPTIVLKDNGGNKFPYFITGAAGGPRIPTAVTQASLGVLFYGWSLSDAIEQRRLHVKFDNDTSTVYVESGYPSNIINFLQGLGHTVETDDTIAVVQGVVKESNGKIFAHSDSRKMGQPYIPSY